MKAIHGELQHAIVVADIDRKKVRHVVRKTCIERRKISLLKDVMIRKRFDEKVIFYFAGIGLQNLWEHFKNGV